MTECCFSCKSQYHSIKNCPLIHYTPWHSLHILKHIHKNEQERAPFLRKKRLKNNSLRNFGPNNFFARQLHNEVKYITVPISEQDEVDQTSFYASEHTLDSEEDFSENDEVCSRNYFRSLQSIKKNGDSLEVIDEECRSNRGSMPSTFKFAHETVDDKFTNKLIDSRVFEVKTSRILTEGGRMFEDYLKRNSLLSAHSSIPKVPSNSELIKNASTTKNSLAVNTFINPNTNSNLSENRQVRRRNSEARAGPSSIAPQIQTNTQNTSKSNKSNKLKHFEFFMEMESVKEFNSYFPTNNMNEVISKIKNRNKSQRSIRTREKRKKLKK